VSGFIIPIPGLNKPFVVPSIPDLDMTWGKGDGKIKNEKRLKRQAEKKRKKLHRKQGRH